MNSKLYSFFHQLYSYLKVSLYFWLYLVRGWVIYGLIPAGCALILTIREVKDNKERDEVAVLFKKYWLRYSRYKFPSFLFSFIIIVFWSVLFSLNMQDNSLAAALTIAAFYFFTMTFVLLAYAI
ncbi:hypothetical protein [Bacillus sp. FSL K6-3431]|uniref:hypothetical protein n=1 Tax=Bacillus sp. FSL K6-3431 TaxID=2921500 RepID=UPI0030F4B401